MTFGKIRTKSISAVVKYTPSSKSWTARNRHEHIIGIHKGGKALHEFGYKSFYIEDGSIYFLNQKDDYSVNVLEPGTAFSIHFTTFEPINQESLSLKTADVDELMQLWQKAEKLYLKNEESDAELLSVVYKFISVFQSRANKNYIKKDERILKAKEYIDLNFKQENCINKAACIFGVTSRRFNDIFRLSFGFTPGKYVVFKKIELAKNLLRCTSFSISEISDLTGFKDIYYFSKAFKKETGVSPTEYKRTAT